MPRARGAQALPGRGTPQHLEESPPMRERYCYWSAVDGIYAQMMQTVVDSAREAGVFKDFHVWTDRPIDGATCHPAANFDKTLYLFKLRFLRDEVSRLDYDYFVWLDADSYFVRD